MPRWRRRRGPEREPRYQVVEVIGASEQLDEAVGRAAERLAEQRAAAARRGRRGLGKLVLLTAAVTGAAAATYGALRALLGRGPEAGPLPGPLEGASGEAQSARDAIEAGIAEGRRASAEAERELREDLRARREGRR
ncbi:MAG: hypothetical protein F4X25_08570 [Chloroflexi bacterium]|nr:hypothetical protein [Chloroflexota bacterium]